MTVIAEKPRRAPRRNRSEEPAKQDAGQALEPPADLLLPTMPETPVPQCSVAIEVIRLPLATLQSAGQQYQRPIDWRRVERLAAHLRPESLGTLLINQRPDGTYWIVDGQHRTEALRKVYGEAFAWWCFLIHVAGPAEEAAVFVEVNAEHARPTPGVLFQGRLIRGEPAALAIEQRVLAEGLSLHLERGREGPNEVSTSVLDEIYQKWDGERVRAVLQFMRTTWGEQKGFNSASVLSGVATFFAHYGEHKAFDAERVSAALKEVQLPYLQREAKMVAGKEFCHRHVGFAMAMQQLYNSKCESAADRLYRKREPEKKLRRKAA